MAEDVSTPARRPTLTAPAPAGVRDVRAGTQKRTPQGPNRKTAVNRRTRCRHSRYPEPKPSPLHETGASPNAPDKHLGGVTYGGYSDQIVVDERFVLRVPSNLDLAGAGPLLCAGITTYSPMRHWGAAKGKKVGVVGLGGLGHMGVKFAHAFGAHVVVFTTSPGKKEDALRLGADEVVVSRNTDEMQKHAGSFDFILDAVSADHDINAYINLLRRDGNITLVGAPEEPLAVSAFGLSMGRRSLSGSAIGGIAETQEMLDFCGAHNITADVEVIPIQKVNEAYERLLKSDVKYRFSIDMASLRSE